MVFHRFTRFRWAPAKWLLSRPPHNFSVGNNAVKDVQNNLGNRVVVFYRQWVR